MVSTHAARAHECTFQCTHAHRAWLVPGHRVPAVLREAQFRSRDSKRTSCATSVGPGQLRMEPDCTNVKQGGAHCGKGDVRAIIAIIA